VGEIRNAYSFLNTKLKIHKIKFSGEMRLRGDFSEGESGARQKRLRTTAVYRMHSESNREIMLTVTLALK
jgi:hypothetical protein